MASSERQSGGYCNFRRITCRTKKVIALGILVLLLCPPAASDGMIFIEDNNIWQLQQEETQLAAIHYQRGIENLLISVSPGKDFHGEQATWIFPVPAKPDEIHIDVLKGFPPFGGKNLEDTYYSSVTTSSAVQIFYATFPVSFLCGGSILQFSGSMNGVSGSMRSLSSYDVTPGIQIHRHIEKRGVSTEVVTAADADSLETYLSSLGMTAKNDNQAYFQEYIGKEYSFVITYISDMHSFKAQSDADIRGSTSHGTHSNALGIFVRFPTERIFYPLKPTAIYGTSQIPVLLYVTGLNEPALSRSILDHTEVSYFMQEHFEVSADLEPFFNGNTAQSRLPYTKIKISTPAESFTEDLWIDPGKPLEIQLKWIYTEIVGIISVIVYIFLSSVSSLLAGLIVFRKKPVNPRTLLFHGLWNCITFIGLVHATRKKFPQTEYGTRGSFILVFYLIFAALISIYTILLSPTSAAAVGFGWIIALLSPLLSLGLLLMIPTFFSGIEYMAPGWIFIAILYSLIIGILALIPIPALLWLKAWIDPEKKYHANPAER